MNIAVCIPAYYAHLKYLPEVLESISNQTRPPFLISLSISSVPPGTRLQIPSNAGSIPILVNSTHEQKYGAANRNIAADAALKNSQVDGLVFIDIDDYMHPLYLEKVQAAFAEGADVFLHNYYNWPGRRLPATDACEQCLITTPTSYQSYFHEEMKPAGYGQISPFDENNKMMDITNGHVSLKRFVFEREQFNEGSEFRRVEDCHYNYRLLQNGYNILASADQLSLYFW
jgi:glycosyltransferase involved in cell wall biosynthesis